MAGQSNMAGRGVIEPQDREEQPRILAMDSNNRFVLAREPLHFYQPGLSGLDCGMSFGKTLLQSLDLPVKVGLIPCAVGSSSIEEWVHDEGGLMPLYSNMLTRARAGAEKGTIKGILWHQGETNASDSTYRNYEANLTLLITNWRYDLGRQDLPVFAAKLAAFYKHPFKDSINAAIERVAAKLPYVYVVSTDDLSCKADSVHFDSQAQRLLGQRFAMLALLHQ